MVIAIRQIAFVGFQQKRFRIRATRTHTDTRFGSCSHTQPHTRSRIHEKPFSFLFLFFTSSACIRSVSFARLWPQNCDKCALVPSATVILRSFPLAVSYTILPGCTSGSIHLASSYSVNDALTHAHIEYEKLCTHKRTADVCVCGCGEKSRETQRGSKICSFISFRCVMRAHSFA